MVPIMTEFDEKTSFFFKREDYCPKLLIISEKKMHFFLTFFYVIAEKISSRLFFMRN